ncbi:MAG: cell division protein FtsA [Candidatus Omnitrophica bacterium]|nr:cell division protein FtsA [Candidatus Omnitrophota bacterium]
MLKSNYLCALDIGSSKIVAVVAEIHKKQLKNIFFESMPVKGVRKGVVVDSIELVGTVTKLMKNLRAKSGINIKSLCVNISGQDIVTKHSRAIIPLAERGNKVVTLSDIQLVSDQARVLGSSLEEEIIHQIPSSFTIDSKSNIANPLGLYSHRLEVDLYLISAKLSSVQSLARVIHQSGYDIKSLFFSGFATAKAVFNQEFKDGVNIFCDVGSDITELLTFRDGLLKDINILEAGGDALTQELSDALKIPWDLAEEIKKSYGVIGDSSQIDEDKEILVKKSNLYRPIKQREVSEIITVSSKKMCSKIKDEIEKKLSTYEVNNLVISGRTVLLEGFIETLESILSIPVRLARISDQQLLGLVKESNELSGQKYLTYLPALGMICEILVSKPVAMQPAHQNAKHFLQKITNKFKEVYQEYF